MKMNRIIAALLAAAVIPAAAGCSGTRKAAVTATEEECRAATEAAPVSELIKGIWITPRKNLIKSDEDADARFAEIAEAGINLVHIHPSDCSDKKYVKRQLQAAADHNIKVIIELPAAYTDSDISNNLKIVQYAIEYPSLYGFNLQDEPVASRFEMLKKEYDAIKEFAGEDTFVMINLLPNYGPQDAMAPEIEEGLTWYQTYVNYCVKYDCSDIICYDYYPYHISHDTDQMLLAGSVSNMCDIISCAQDSGRKASAFIQDSSWAGTRIPNDAEVRFQTHLYLAFGFDNFTYFLYCQPSDAKGAEGIFEGMLTYGGERTEIYTRVQKNNEDLDGLRGIYHNYTFKGLIRAGCPDYLWNSVSSRYQLKKFVPVKSVSGENVLASCFENDSGKAIYLVNSDTENPQSVKVTFSSYSDYRVWGSDGIEAMGSGMTVSTTLLPGEGKFVEIG